ncbi:uncharacterized protein SPSC_01497 [Sporisorium scitamineum]|uniref:Uncharacterized protein n=1 Tax=Sporisorium scitamineum TaxID=49012 RepID=A0A127ZB64_9BASI|nr:uncharacterized protein SPSC_01497 [Sporisorium scitamineum]
MGGLEEEDGLEEKDELEGDRRGWALRCTPKMLLRSRMRRSTVALVSLRDGGIKFSAGDVEQSGITSIRTDERSGLIRVINLQTKDRGAEPAGNKLATEPLSHQSVEVSDPDLKSFIAKLIVSYAAHRNLATLKALGSAPDVEEAVKDYMLDHKQTPLLDNPSAEEELSFSFL